jgi:hypothetical protein
MWLKGLVVVVSTIVLCVLPTSSLVRPNVPTEAQKAETQKLIATICIAAVRSNNLRGELKATCSIRQWHPSALDADRLTPGPPCPLMTFCDITR